MPLSSVVNVVDGLTGIKMNVNTHTELVLFIIYTGKCLYVHINGDADFLYKNIVYSDIFNLF